MGIRRRDTDPRLLAEATLALKALHERLAAPPVDATALEGLATDAAAAQRALLGADAPILAALDPRSAATLLGDPERIALWAALGRVEADARRRQGDAARAGALERRAAALADLARELGDAGRPR